MEGKGGLCGAINRQLLGAFHPIAINAIPLLGKSKPLFGVSLKPTDGSTAGKPKKKSLCGTFKRTGECRFGDSCKFGHTVSADTPTPATNLPAAVAMQDPEEDQMGVDLEEFTCGANLGPGCTKTFKTCPSFWTELGKERHTAFVTPNSCRYCRKIKRGNHRRPNAKVDSDGKPIAELADLAMAANEPTDEPFFSDLDTAMMTRWLITPQDSSQT